MYILYTYKDTTEKYDCIYCEKIIMVMLLQKIYELVLIP